MCKKLLSFWFMGLLVCKIAGLMGFVVGWKHTFFVNAKDRVAFSEVNVYLLMSQW